MSQKYDLLPMAFKYDIGPRQFLFRPSSSLTSDIPFTKEPQPQPPSYIPMAATAEEPMAPLAGTLHRVPSNPRLSTDSDADSIVSTQARLICPTSHHIAQKDYTGTIYPTAILRLVAAPFLITTIGLFSSYHPARSVAVLVFICLALLRILFVFLVHTPRGAQWRGGRGVNVAVDFAIVVGMCVGTGASRVLGHTPATTVACIFSWVSCMLLALAAVDTGRPTRVAITTTLSLDFWNGDGALSLGRWDEERGPEMGASASLLA